MPPAYRLGPVHSYSSIGTQIDQIQNAIHLINNDPNSRRIIVNAWNVGELEQMALTPCHCLFQFFVADGRLSCQLYQRRSDIGLGVPFNIVSYSLLTMMMAQVCELKPGEFVWTGGDAHIYLNHVDALQEQLTREPRELPRMAIAGRGRIVPAKPVAEPAAADGDTNASSCAHRLGWAALMARVLGADLSACAACGGRLRIIAALTDRDLSGRGRVARGAPAEGPAAAAVRVRGLTSPPFAPGAVSRREKCVLNGLIEYRIGPARGPQTTKPYCEPCQTTCNRSSASLPCPLGVFGALTRGPKRCLILPILRAEESHLYPPEGPGLGVVLDEDRMRELTVASA